MRTSEYSVQLVGTKQTWKSHLSIGAVPQNWAGRADHSDFVAIIQSISQVICQNIGIGQTSGYSSRIWITNKVLVGHSATCVQH